MKYKNINLISVLVLIFGFFSCKSTNLSVDSVDPLALLSKDSSIYVSVPVSNHQELCSKLLYNIVDSVSEKDANLLVSKIDKIYAGLGTVENLSRLELVANIDVPKIAVNSILSKKNGWDKFSYTSAIVNPSKSYNYFSRADTNLSLAFLSPDIFMCGTYLVPMFDSHALSEKIGDMDYEKYLLQESEDILFYITRPGQYLRNLIGDSITIGTDYIYGKIIPLENEKNLLYEMELNIHLTEAKLAPRLVPVLSLSLKLLGGKVKLVDDLLIKVTGLEFSYNRIEQIFTRESISGKHFKVVGDSIITESRK